MKFNENMHEISVSSGVNSTMHIYVHFHSPGNRELVSFHKHDGILFIRIFSWKQVTNLKVNALVELTCSKKKREKTYCYIRIRVNELGGVEV